MPSGIFTLKQQTLAVQESAWPGMKTPAVNYLVVAGGGAGGDNQGPGTANGGGGGGGLLTGSIPVAAGSAITVTVGAGSGRFDARGGSSVFGSIVTTGGGTGGRAGLAVANSGGSGGGGASGSTSVYANPGVAVGGEGNVGGTAVFISGGGGGGGGGAGDAGANGLPSAFGGSGGNGVASDISGVLTAYAGGGGGGGSNVGFGAGGVGGGGAGNSTNGTVNTGGGGGSAAEYSNAGTGGSGIVIISYPDTYAAATSTTGSPTVSTSGSGSIAFNGTNQALIYPSSTNYAFGTGDFTVEMFIYRSNTGGIILDARSGALSETWAMYCRNSTKLGWYTGPLDVETPSDIPLNSWAHIAACRSGTTTRLFINGVLETSFTDITNYTTTSTLKIGRNAGGSGYFGGNMSNIRITKGVALYTSGFTVPTAPLSRSASTGLLLSAMSGSTYVDFSGNATITTAEGSSLWSSSSPFATGLGYKNRVYTWTSSGSITF